MLLYASKKNFYAVLSWEVFLLSLQLSPKYELTSILRRRGEERGEEKGEEEEVEEGKEEEE